MTQEIDLSLIVAMTPTGLIGRNYGLPWGRIPSDMRFFSKITKAAEVVIAGNGTYQSYVAAIGGPLKGRKNVVLSRRFTSHGTFHESVLYVGSVEEACEVVSNYGGRAFIVGGAEIYKAFLHTRLVSRVYVTMVHAPELTGDTYFPFYPDFHRYYRETGATATRRWDERDAHETSRAVFTRILQPEPEPELIAA